MDQTPSEPRQCRVCGAPILPEHRFCPNCGTLVVPDAASTSPGVTGQPERPAPLDDSDPSTLETREFETQPPPAPPERPSASHPAPTPSYDTTYQHAGQPTWGTPETTVPPERGNRTLWIILGIVAFIVLVCCCILPLGLLAVSNFDTAFQDELRSLVESIVV